MEMALIILLNTQWLTIENDDECAMEYGSICFGSLNEVINDDDLVSLGEGKAQVKHCLRFCQGMLKMFRGLARLVENTCSDIHRLISVLYGYFMWALRISPRVFL